MESISYHNVITKSIPTEYRTTSLLLSNRATASLWGAEWRIDQPMEEFLTTNGISITSTQGRPLALQQLATLRRGATG